ncbi:MAG TPA: glycosyltransferase, partial [Verrucomicrobiae bacterium]|nr:glycosyltransferase [Verrucomicrobiae bacterium]
DTQSALKVFKSHIAREIKINPTPWTFDLEFLIQSKNSGYKIASHDIIFEPRKTGDAKIDLIKAIWEIGSNAVKLKVKGTEPVAIKSHQADSMHGAGYVHRGKRYVTHSTLPHHISAIQTLIPWQKLFVWTLFILAIFGFALYPLRTAIIFTSILSIIYFIDVVFNLFLVSKSLNAPPELSFNPSELSQLNENELPVYSILCPLYREAHVLPGFLEAIEKLDWPKNKLDVQLLLEENDVETITAAEGLMLPPYVRVVIVPHSFPKTKPKACNYGLSLAQGEYLVIYDAEDIPEPNQLKKAYLAFQRVGPEVVCLQAKLNYFNPHHNLLTRLFTAEYSLWFDVVLPGLQSINAYIPLGGTSNHFRTKDLLKLHGWDPFNVTEDCDLGARLFKQGSTTAIIDSTTLEEANSNLKNWLRQRSRWIKGYMQTYLVHMRHPVQFFKESGIQALVFQLVVGGKIAFMLINPFLWLMTISYFAARATLGPTIEALYPPIIFYIAVTSLIVGNFLYLYYYMIGCAKREHWSVIKYVYLVPVYWFMASLAAVIALYQLIVKPHYWEKTNHGLHLRKVFINYKDIIEEPKRGLLPESWNRALVSSGGLLLMALSVNNFINFLFNAFMGRVLNFEQLALVTLVNTLWYVISLFVSAYGNTINHRVSYLSVHDSAGASNAFFVSFFKSALLITVLITLAWVAGVPILSAFLNISDPLILLFFAPVLTFGIIGAANRGYMQGHLSFGAVSTVVLIEAFSKLAAGVVLVVLGLNNLVYLAIPFSVVMAAAASYLLLPRIGKVQRSPEPFPRAFYLGSLFSGLSATVFLSLDIILVKHYLSAVQAGQYVLLALVGKMIYFFGSLPNNLTTTFVGRETGLNKNPNKVFLSIFGFSLFLVVTGALILGPFGSTTIPLLLGEKTLTILPYTNIYIIAISLFTLTNVIVSYHLARKKYEFPIASLLASFIMAASIVWDHRSIASIVENIFFSSVLGFGAIGLMHLIEPEFKFIKRIGTDFLDLFRTKVPSTESDFTRRILVFNWRDTKHMYAGGAEVYIHELAKKWTLLGHQVTLFCGNDGQSAREEVVDGIRIVRRGGFYFVYFWAFVYYLTKFRGKYDLIIDCQNGIPFFTPLFVKEPVFCVVHHVHQEIFRKYLFWPLAVFAQFLEKGLMPIVYRNIKFITVSASTKEAMENIGLVGSGIEIVHNGVDLSKFVPGEKSLKPSVLYLGRLKAYKSVDVLVKAFQKIKQTIPDAVLTIAGSGDEEPFLKKLVKDLGLDGIEFKGRVSEEEKVGLLQRAWVFVNPSYIEGWGITTIEANACATPVVGANVPGLRDSIRNPHTGYLVEHGNVELFADRILLLLENKELREDLGRQAVEWASNFEWKKMSETFLDVLNDRNFNSEPVLSED